MFNFLGSHLAHGKALALGCVRSLMVMASHQYKYHSFSFLLFIPVLETDGLCRPGQEASDLEQLKTQDSWWHCVSEKCQEVRGRGVACWTECEQAIWTHSLQQRTVHSSNRRRHKHLGEKRLWEARISYILPLAPHFPAQLLAAATSIRLRENLSFEKWGLGLLKCARVITTPTLRDVN